ncbi:amidophosphoribosyltransferase [Gleimia sp. 6138-11-ORH1]|uniref:amidophosphoribosyltransferase n=1 Tax=Gleimia sp. 6138-11-ORH1 TaxID=2973937 RepID=UPI00216A3395|nr:amidophosphoribosyltransferase [Gleimia sp. 6138-11-ORH1]MCS4484701.1 amidophosphoribosyltransferase [Gleimia sp. 6138-11-ORH1]
MLPEDELIQEECGVFGVWAPGEEVSRFTYFGLFALQHRGQQSAGIAVSDGRAIRIYKDMGLVSQVFDDQALTGLKGHLAVGHVRYATTGADIWENAQPALGPTPTGSVALAHNGNLTNTLELRKKASEISDQKIKSESTDTAVLTALLGAYGSVKEKSQRDETKSQVDVPQTARGSLIEAALNVLPEIDGAFSLCFMDERTLYGARDAHGIRPLVLGRLARGWVLASETAALDIVGADFVREIEPGELIAIDSDGVRSFKFAQPTPHGCAFEYLYLARPDTKIAGKSIIVARQAMGAALAKEYPIDADLVIATPESGTPAAIGYAQASGIPYAQGLVKNAYVGRTFIQPTQSLRQLGIRLKLNPLREVIEGKRLVVVDDSIVRGNTQRALVSMLRAAGAKEVHVRISAPPVMWPCFFGIDFPTRAELISSSMDTEAVCRSIGADSLGYLTLEALVEATGQPKDRLCLACFNGEYPMPIPPGTPVPGTPGATTC